MLSVVTFDDVVSVVELSVVVTVALSVADVEIVFALVYVPLSDVLT
jgi:hypothetical protein